MICSTSRASKLIMMRSIMRTALYGPRARPRTLRTSAARAAPLPYTTALPAVEPWTCHDRPIEEATTLPASWYTSHSMPQLEQRRVFGRSWQLVGHAAQVSEPGQYFTGALAPWRYIVARGDDGTLRAFHNVCRHHAAAVAQGCGRGDEWVCPYHGWTYDTRGRLRKAPRVRGIRDFKASEWGLRPIRLDTWGPFIFLWLGGGAHQGRGGGCGECGGGGDGGGGGGGAGAAEEAAPSLAEWLGSGAERMAELGLADPLVHIARRTYELNCNWKVFADNYLDGGYHVPIAHPALAAQLDLGDYRSELHPRLSLQTCAPGAEADGRVRGARPAGYFFLHPNIMINRYGPWMDSNVVVPAPGGHPGRCLVHFDWWLEAGALEQMTSQQQQGQQQQGQQQQEEEEEQGRQEGPRQAGAAGRLEFTHAGAAALPYVADSLASSHQVQLEDMRLCEAVQAGLEEPSYGVGRYAPELERPMFHFHQLLHDDIMRGA